MIIFITGGSACGKSEYAEKVAIRLFEEMHGNANGCNSDSDNESEKSIIADRRCKDCGDNEIKQSIADERCNIPAVTYLVTMRNDSAEAERRIARHRRLRGDHPYNIKECFSCEDLNRLIESQFGNADEDYKNRRYPPDRSININSGENLYKNRFFRNNYINNKKQHIVLFDCLSVFAANVLFSEDMQSDNGQLNYGKTRIKRVADDICAGISRLAEVCGSLIIVADMVFSDGCVYDEATDGYIELLGRVCRYAASEADDVVEVVCGIPIMIKGDDYEFLKIHRISDFDVYKDSNAEIGNE